MKSASTDFPIPMGGLMNTPPKGPMKNTSPQRGTGCPEFLPFICLLESYKTKFKNLHWAAINHPQHVVVGDFLADLDEFQDELAETGQGMLGQFSANDITTEHISYNDPLDAIDELKKAILVFHQCVKEVPELVGLVNSIEGFMTTVGKYVYLLRLAKK